MPYSILDQSVERALPDEAGAVTSPAIDLAVGPRSDFVVGAELLLTVPALDDDALPDDATLVYALVHSTNADLSEATTLVAAAITQTGAGDAGAAGGTYRFRPPTNVKRYVGFVATGADEPGEGAPFGDASGESATLQLFV